MLDAVGRSATRQAAEQAAGPGGTVVLPGLRDQETSCDVHAIIRSQVALLGSSASSQDDGRRAASLLEEGQVILEIFAALLISCVTLYRYVSLLAQYGRQSSLPVDHVPVRFAFGRPTPASHRSLDFASGVRWEPEDALDWGERTRSRTVRTFHHCDATIGKPFGINGNHPKKRAFGCFARLNLFLDRFHRFRHVLLLAFLDRFPLSLCPIGTLFRLFVPFRDGSVWPGSINDLKRIMAQHKQLCGGLEPLGSHIGSLGLVRPFQGRRHQLHQVIHRHAARVSWVEDRMRQPGVDRACPLAQVELRKERQVQRFQGGQDVTDFFTGIACNAAERCQFVEATAELQPGRIRLV
jgi:hypothetical protein